jgi:hypothetical protein
MNAPAEIYPQSGRERGDGAGVPVRRGPPLRPAIVHRTSGFDGGQLALEAEIAGIPTGTPPPIPARGR